MQEPVVAVALSGGVDSLVAAFLIKQRFKTVFGIHFTTGYETSHLDVKNLSAQLNIPVHTVDLSNPFEREVVTYFTATYLKGKTPNPCLQCNREIKFGALMDAAAKLGAACLATGHYATVVNAVSFPEKKIVRPFLAKGADPLKDQSYFLARLTPSQLEKVIFPLSGQTKADTRAIALENNLCPLTPDESQDICFIHGNDFSRFIVDKKKLIPQSGPIKDTKGKRIGTHNGLHTFTVGQRRGINCPAQEPYYVKRIDPAANTLHVCFKKDLATTKMAVGKLLWNDADIPKGIRLVTKIRYSHNGAPCRLQKMGETAQVVFESPQNAVTPGQAAVFYHDDRVMGSGIIQ